MIASTKACTGCKEIKDRTEFYFNKSAGYSALCKPCLKTYVRERRIRRHADPKLREQDREKNRRNHVKRKYGLTAQEYEAMHQTQKGCSAICATPISLRGSAKEGARVDHDHATGWIRGLLCLSCNTVLGHAYDDPERLKAAATYLEHHLGF